MRDNHQGSAKVLPNNSVLGDDSSSICHQRSDSLDCHVHRLNRGRHVRLYFRVHLLARRLSVHSGGHLSSNYYVHRYRHRIQGSVLRSGGGPLLLILLNVH